MNLIAMIIIASNAYQIDPKDLRAIIQVETSGGLHTIQHHPNANGTRDHGVSQLNDITIEEYRLDKARILTDHQYAITSTAMILDNLRSRFPKSYMCRYHTGVAKFNDKRRKLCDTYNKKLKHAKENL